MPLDLHRVAEERSLAYHRAIAARIARDPALLEQARARVRGWLASPPGPLYARGWREVLSRSVPEILAFLADEGEYARELRQSTPFAGVLPPRERWRIWRSVGDRMRDAG
jgi:hypothetical protein